MISVAEARYQPTPGHNTSAMWTPPQPPTVAPEGAVRPPPVPRGVAVELRGSLPARLFSLSAARAYAAATGRTGVLLDAHVHGHPSLPYDACPRAEHVVPPASRLRRVASSDDVPHVLDYTDAPSHAHLTCTPECDEYGVPLVLLRGRFRSWRVVEHALPPSLLPSWPPAARAAYPHLPQSPTAALAAAPVLETRVADSTARLLRDAYGADPPWGPDVVGVHVMLPPADSREAPKVAQLLQPSYYARALRAAGAGPWTRLLLVCPDATLSADAFAAAVGAEGLQVSPARVTALPSHWAPETALAALAQCGRVVTSNAALSWWAARHGVRSGAVHTVVAPTPWLDTDLADAPWVSARVPVELDAAALDAWRARGAAEAARDTAGVHRASDGLRAALERGTAAWHAAKASVAARSAAARSRDLVQQARALPPSRRLSDVHVDELHAHGEGAVVGGDPLCLWGTLVDVDWTPLAAAVHALGGGARVLVAGADVPHDALLPSVEAWRARLPAGTRAMVLHANFAATEPHDGWPPDVPLFRAGFRASQLRPWEFPLPACWLRLSSTAPPPPAAEDAPNDDFVLRPMPPHAREGPKVDVSFYGTNLPNAACPSLQQRYTLLLQLQRHPGVARLVVSNPGSERARLLGCPQPLRRALWDRWLRHMRGASVVACPPGTHGSPCERLYVALACGRVPLVWADADFMLPLAPGVLPSPWDALHAGMLIVRPHAQSTAAELATSVAGTGDATLHALQRKASALYSALFAMDTVGPLLVAQAEAVWERWSVDGDVEWLIVHSEERPLGGGCGNGDAYVDLVKQRGADAYTLADSGYTSCDGEWGCRSEGYPVRWETLQAMARRQAPWGADNGVGMPFHKGALGRLYAWVTRQNSAPSDEGLVPLTEMRDW